MRVLGIDPGYAIVGWGVVEYAGNRFAPVDFGAVCTDAGVPFERRLDEVYTGIKDAWRGVIFHFSFNFISSYLNFNYYGKSS